MPWVWSACSWVKSTPSSESTSASRSCSRRSGDVSTSTRVTAAASRRFTRSDVRRRRFWGLPGSHAPQPSAGRGTPPEEPQPRIVNFMVMRTQLPQRGLRKDVCADLGTRDLAEEAKEILGGLPGDLVGRYRPRLGQNFGRLDHVGGLVSLPSILAGSQIRRVGLDQNALRGQASRNGAEGIGFPESQDSGERDEETERDGTLREIRAAGEAVQHGRESAFSGFLLEDPRHVLIGVTRMNDERQSGGARGGDVVAEAPLLRLTWAQIVVVIEPSLSDRNHLGMARAHDQVVHRDVELLMRMVRMGADRAIDIGKAFGDGEHLAVSPHARRNRHHAPDVRRTRTPNQGVQFAGEVGKIQMTMAIDQHQ